MAHQASGFSGALYSLKALSLGAGVWQAVALWPLAWVPTLELGNLGSNPCPVTVEGTPNHPVPQCPHLYSEDDSFCL